MLRRKLTVAGNNVNFHINIDEFFKCLQDKKRLEFRSLLPCLDPQKVLMLYRFESLDTRNVHKGDGGEVQDQAVEVHSGNADAPRNVQLRRNDAGIAEAIQTVALPVGLLMFIDEVP